MIILLCAGIRGLRGQDLNEKQRKMQSTADDWVRRRVQQQENIYVEIESLDRNSNFLGHVLLGKGGMNLSQHLLEEGWCQVLMAGARRSRYCDRFVNAETSAKEKQLGQWEGYVEEDIPDPANKGDPAKSKKAPEKHNMQDKKVRGTVTYVESATELFIVLKGEKQYDDNYNAVTNYMRSVNPSVNLIQRNPFKTGDLVAGLFHGGYYRCRISSIRRKDKIHNVKFIDFGNRGHLEEDQILPLERYDNNGICVAGGTMKTIPPLARRCRLAGLKPPPEKSIDYCNQAGRFFAEHAYEDVDIEVLQVRRERKFEVYEVELKKNGVNLNEMMVAQGWCRVDDKAYNMWGGGRDKRPPKYPERKARLQELSNEAQQKHRGMYTYGNVDSDDEMA